jgi:hypothetical protein
MRYLLDEAAPPEPLEEAAPPPLPPLLLDAAPPPVPAVPPLLVPELDVDEEDLPPAPPGLTTVVSLRSHPASANTLNAATNT